MTATSSPAATELWRAGAIDLASLVRTRQVSSREVVEAHLARIGTHNAHVNALTLVLADAALEAADNADRAVARRDATGPFHGVPFTVKENIDLGGTATTAGLRALAGAVAPRDAPVVERMRAAGAIPLGHTNCPTLTLRWHTHSELWGATRNPWDPTLTPGASSGGEAAAIATGMSPIGLGNDGLGSLRWPAQCCGVAALKPTLGRIPRASSIEPIDAPIGVQLTAVEGPMARRVGDLRAALDVLAGTDPRDPWSVEVPVAGPPIRRPIRVAVVADPGGGGVARQVRAGVVRAAEALADSGYVCEDVEPLGIEDAARALLDMLTTPEIRAAWAPLAAIVPPDTQRFMEAFFAVAGDADPIRPMRGFVTRLSLGRSWSAFQETWPLILAPIGTEPPFEAWADLGDGRVAETIHDMRMAMAVNALGLPAVAVPVGIGAGLPQVLQVIGPRHREDLCLDAGEAIEARLGVVTPIDPLPRGVRES